MTEWIPEVLTGVLRKGKYVESLEALRDLVARALECDYCEHCQREGPSDAKDLAALTLRLTDILKSIETAERGAVPGGQEAPPAPAGGPASVTDIQARARAARDARTGVGTESTASPTSAARRQGNYGRRPGAGRKAGS